jgi:hypothetical protein
MGPFVLLVWVSTFCAVGMPDFKIYTPDQESCEAIHKALDADPVVGHIKGVCRPVELPIEPANDECPYEGYPG